MKTAITNGLNVSVNPFMKKCMVVRMEKTGEHITMSIADEDNGMMLMVVVNDKVKELLKDMLK